MLPRAEEAAGPLRSLDAFVGGGGLALGIARAGVPAFLLR
jgi:hypothetical protein